MNPEEQGLKHDVVTAYRRAELQVSEMNPEEQGLKRGRNTTDAMKAASSQR